MPKRLANCRGFGNARFGRQHIGWRKVKMLGELEKVDQALNEGNIAEDALQKYQDFKAFAKKTLKGFYPGRAHRHQSR